MNFYVNFSVVPNFWIIKINFEIQNHLVILFCEKAKLLQVFAWEILLLKKLETEETKTF